MSAPKPRRWTPFAMTTPRAGRNSPVIDPTPLASRAKTVRITGKGTGEIRASDKVGR